MLLVDFTPNAGSINIFSIKEIVFMKKIKKKKNDAVIFRVSSWRPVSGCASVHSKSNPVRHLTPGEGSVAFEESKDVAAGLDNATSPVRTGGGSPGAMDVLVSSLKTVSVYAQDWKKKKKTSYDSANLPDI